MEDRRNGDANQQSLRLVTGIPKPVKYLVVATKKKVSGKMFSGSPKYMASLAAYDTNIHLSN